MDEMVAIQRWALEFFLENANLIDAGPPGEGWRSDEMEKAVSALTMGLLKTMLKIDA